MKENRFAKPHFMPRIFWDCDIDKIDYQLNKDFVIERIYTRGTQEDMNEALLYYGEDVIKESIVRIRYLEPKTLNFLSIIFDIPKRNFQCYEKTLSKNAFGLPS